MQIIILYQKKKNSIYIIVIVFKCTGACTRGYTLVIYNRKKLKQSTFTEYMNLIETYIDYYVFLE